MPICKQLLNVALHLFLRNVTNLKLFTRIQFVNIVMLFNNFVSLIVFKGKVTYRKY